MYNSKVKESFIAGYSCCSNLRSIAAHFESVEKSEEKIGKDIAEMSKSEAISTANSVPFFEMATAENFLSTMKSYAKWCASDGIFKMSSDGGIFSVTLSDIDPAIYIGKMFFKNESDFLDSLRSVRGFYDGYPDVVALAFAWLGLSYDEILGLKDSDVDTDLRKIHVNGEILEYSDLINDVFTAFRSCNESIRGNYSVIKDNSTDFFLKRMCSKGSKKFGTPIKKHQLADSISKVNTICCENGGKPVFTMINVLRSGAMSRILSAEKAGLAVFEKENCDQVERIARSGKYRNLIWQYKHYKKAFNL